MLVFMKTKYYQALFVAVFIICSQTAFAGNKYEWAVPLIKEKIESLDKNTKQIGVIDGQKYVVTELKAGTVLIAAKIHADNTYEPIAQAELIELENPTTDSRKELYYCQRGWWASWGVLA
jgi:hypothetical protein